MINGISLDYLKIFYEVAKEKNITKAAEKLYISQPAITQTIEKLEKSLGVTLFVRNKRGVRLTDIGEKIFEKVNAGFLELNSVDDVLSAEKELKSGQITVGCGTNLAKKVLTKPIKHFLKDYPDVSLVHVDELTEKMLDRLELGDIDVCIATESAAKNRNVKFTKIFDEKFVFVCSPDYADKNLSVEDTNYIVQESGSFTRGIFDKYVSDKGLNLKHALQIVGYNMSVDLAINGLGATLLPYYLAEPYLKSGKLKILENGFKSPDIEYGYCLNPHNVSCATAEFVKYIKKQD